MTSYKKWVTIVEHLTLDRQGEAGAHGFCSLRKFYVLVLDNIKTF